jgi:DNA repair protein RAD7
MSRRGNARNNGSSIRGPQSALTDYLASHNISAQQIRLDYQARRTQAQDDGTLPDEDEDAGEDADDAGEGPSTRPAEPEETSEAKKKRKRKEEAALAKIKKSKEFAKRKKHIQGEPGEDDDDGLAWDMYAKAKPLPGQLENCELCAKRFTVTPYSKQGPDGGLLCTKCSKEQEAEKKKDAKVNKKASANREKRRKTQSNLLDHLTPLGTKSLQEHCIELVAANINEIDEFGDLPPKLLKRLSEILSKRRIITARTLDLFLRPDLDTVSVYDCSKLNADDFKKIFMVCPNIQHLTLENAGQFKDEVLDYVLDRGILLKTLKLESPNLITDEKWREFFDKAGSKLETLKLTWLDSAFNDETMEHMVDGCPSLKYLKLKKCFRLGNASISKVAELKKLEHLSLLPKTSIDAKVINHVVQTLGPNLLSLSLQSFENLDDDTLQLIRGTCTKLQKLRIQDNDYCTDAGFASMFSDWPNPPLAYINLADTRDMEHHFSEEIPEDPVGLSTSGFKSLMAHSGSKLEQLNLKSCRYITAEAMMDVFDGKKQYPNLKEVDLSFVAQLDTVCVAGMFKSCPRLERLIAFCCFSVRDVVVPPGVALIGAANAQDSIVQEGDFMTAMMTEMMQGQ